jgi:hypothetical protein
LQQTQLNAQAHEKPKKLSGKIHIEMVHLIPYEIAYHHHEEYQTKERIIGLSLLHTPPVDPPEREQYPEKEQKPRDSDLQP